MTPYALLGAKRADDDDDDEFAHRRHCGVYKLNSKAERAG